MDSHDNDAAMSRIAGAIAEPARTKMLCSLMDGHARTSTEMAVIADISASTASAHLARLKDDGLVKLYTQGRHRYYSLASSQVAQTLETLMVLSANTASRFVSATPSRLQLARTCYDHMAGSLAVRLHDHFIDAGWLVGDSTYQLTQKGEVAMSGLGLDLPTISAQRRRFACSCLDWSMRRPHLAGALGAAFLQITLDRQWLTQDLDSRALGVTAKGKRALAKQFGIEVGSDRVDVTRPAGEMQAVL
ncbi:helix-turn-helix transcriptional regulator [Pseudomonas sp. ADAK18]|uniref:ArsR/SmtB family transcription factor n=1 Tax=Pseudomonas sp. ADAK18 TaxID=2730848 RepID=UPI00146436D5|nr:helix-turn-helix transcriptional regulator [Pseudomonas sp. ADAK18]QJI27994.1 helix-turn-helix transcriptional regulator [Pseudomonas sp. ADAK18]